jgi:hypothetical protein
MPCNAGNMGGGHTNAAVDFPAGRGRFIWVSAKMSAILRQDGAGLYIIMKKSNGLDDPLRWHLCCLMGWCRFLDVSIKKK